MTNLYIATRVITFFGTMLRVFLEHITCRIFKIAAEDIRPFKQSELCGHVEHELVKTRKQAFNICFIPFMGNFILGCALLLSGAYSVIYVGNLSSLRGWLFLIVGISCIANCAPSFEDALSLKDMFFNKETSLVKKILVAPFFGVYYASAFLERFSVTFILAIIFAFVFPHIVNLLFPAITTINQMLSGAV